MLKKFLILLVLFLINFWSFNNIFAEKSITVSAIVGEINHAPKIVITSPSSLNNIWTTEYIQNWTSIAIDFWVTDNESDAIYYTISSSIWVVSNDNWWPVTTSKLISSSELKQFHYLAPSWIYWPQVITLTANDWISVSIKELKIYIY